MKTKNFWLKSVLLTLCMVLSLSCLFACVDEEQLNETNAKVETVTTDLSTLTTKLAALEEKAAKIDTLAAAIEAYKNDAAKAADVEAALAALDAEFTDDIEALEGKLNEFKETVKNDFKDLNAKVDELITKKADQAGLDTANKKIADIEAALKLVSGTDELLALKAELEAALANVDSKWNTYDEATDELYRGEYSLDAFVALVNTVNSDYYAEDDYNAFIAEAERIYFFLGRAISVEQIKGYFAELQTLIDNMPSITETLRAMLAKFPEESKIDVFSEEYMATYAKIVDIESKIVADDEGYTEELKNMFIAFTAAHNNLVAAKNAAVAVDAIVDAVSTPIVWNDSLAEVEAMKLAYEQLKEAYFTNPDFNKYYTKGEGEIDVVVTLSADYHTYLNRYAELGRAAESNIVELFSQLVLNFETKRPLWNQAEFVKADVAKFEAWCAEYHIDVEVDAKTLANIFSAGQVDLLIKSNDYVDAMVAIYNEIGVDELRARIDALVEVKDNVLYNSKAEWTAIHEIMVALADAIAAVEYYDAACDTNYAEMLTASRSDKLAGTDARMAQLIEADAKFAEILAKMQKLLDDGIDYTVKSTIDEYKAEFDVAIGYYAIAADDAETDVDNYDLLCKPVADKYAELISEYKKATKEIKELYEAINAYLAKVEWALKDGNEIQELANQLGEFVEMGVTVTEIYLFLEEDDDEATAVDFTPLFIEFNARAAEYTVKAKKAETAAADVNAMVELNAAFKAGKIKNLEKFQNAWAAVQVWCETYLTAEDLAAVNGDVLEAIKAIQDITKFGETVKYVFVTTANYESAKTDAETAEAAYAAAEEAWATISANMNSLIAEWNNVHYFNDTAKYALTFDGVMKAYEAYVAEYYEAGDTVDVLSEKAVYDLFKTEYDECKGLYDAREGAANIIKGMVNALPVVTRENAQTVLDAVAAIEAAYATYAATYCDDKCLLEADLFKAYQTKALATFAAECKAAEAYVDGDDEQKANEQTKLDTAWESGRQWIAASTTEKVVDYAYGLASSNLVKIVGEIN